MEVQFLIGFANFGGSFLSDRILKYRPMFMEAQVKIFPLSCGKAPGVHLSHKLVVNNQPRIQSFAELYVASNGFSQNKVLSSGSFGRVYRTMLLPSKGIVVAVKCLTETSPSDSPLVCRLSVGYAGGGLSGLSSCSVPPTWAEIWRLVMSY
ncbi:hypothetical protein NE237_014414 [Protea cynaroides]|uniref:Protein kinase domain-containing protein n=1 Tax=Protea cynaroides TaxID=273540 RepID=A0A9Q0KBX8_9MAGN|nr:hypothetical protein NE237_014414 [Protea cynaroides]